MNFFKNISYITIGYFLYQTNLFYSEKNCPLNKYIIYSNNKQIVAFLNIQKCRYSLIIFIANTYEFVIITDENECKYRPCDVFAHCTNTLGSFACTCFPGYKGNGLHCEGKC